MDKAKFKRLVGIFRQRFTGAEVTITSVMIAYYLLLSLFPLLIAIGNILPYFKIDPASAMDYLALALPESVMPTLEPIVYNLLTNSSGGLLSVGVIGAIWSASKGIGYLQRGVNKAYGLPGAGNFIMRKLVSLATIVLILLLLVAFVLVNSLGEMLLTRLAPALPWAAALLQPLLSLQWPIAISFVFALMLLLYRVTPDVRIRMKEILPGAALATTGLLVLVQGFSIYIRLSARSFSSYGALGAFFVLMFWLNFSAMILIVGAVLNASLHELRYGKAEEQIGRVDEVIENTRESLKGRAWRLRRRRTERKVKRELADALEELEEQAAEKDDLSPKA